MENLCHRKSAIWYIKLLNVKYKQRMGRGIFVNRVIKVEVVDLSVIYQGCFAALLPIAYSGNICDIELVIIYYDSEYVQERDIHFNMQPLK